MWRVPPRLMKPLPRALALAEQRPTPSCLRLPELQPQRGSLGHPVVAPPQRTSVSKALAGRRPMLPAPRPPSRAQLQQEPSQWPRVRLLGARLPMKPLPRALAEQRPKPSCQVLALPPLQLRTSPLQAARSPMTRRSVALCWAAVAMAG